jgi:hypothetical protein
MDPKLKDESGAAENVVVSLPGTVDKIIPALGSQPEKAQIAVQGAEALYREIRVDNKMQNLAGEDVRLKLGATVEVTIEAKPEATIPE